MVSRGIAFSATRTRSTRVEPDCDELVTVHSAHPDRDTDRSRDSLAATPPGATPVIVTGASGFIGRRLCHVLERAGTRVIALGRTDVDVTDRRAVGVALSEPAECRVVHLAATKPRANTLPDFRSAFNTNVLGLLNIIDAVQGRCSRFVSLGTTEEFGAISVPFDSALREAPTTPYGVSKLAATHLVEALVRCGALPAVVLRPTVVYGPGQNGTMLVPTLLRALLSGTRFRMSAGEQTRDYVYVDDVVSAIVCALTTPVRPVAPLSVSAGAPVRIRDVALTVARIVGDGAEKLIEFGAEPYRAGEPMAYWADNAAARAALGWAPVVSLEEGLRRTVAAWRSNGRRA